MRESERVRQGGRTSTTGVLLVVIALLLAACNGGGSEDTDAAATDDAATTDAPTAEADADANADAEATDADADAEATDADADAEATDEGTAGDADSDVTEGAAPGGGSDDAALDFGGEGLVLGGIFPLTGPQSFLGDFYERGAELRIEELQAAGVDIELVSYDDESSPESSARGAQRLLTRDGVHALFGTGSVPNTAAVATAAADAEVPFLAISGYTVDPEATPFVFNVAPQTIYAVEAAFAHFTEQDLSDVALLMPSGALGEEGVRSAEAAAEATGMTIVASESFDPAAPDVTGQLANIRAADPDAVFSFVTGEPAAQVARSMATIGFDVPLLVSHGNATPGFLQLVSDIAQPIIVPSGLVMVPDSIEEGSPRASVVGDFADAYREAYDEEPNFFAGMAYDAVSLLAQAASDAGSTDPAAIRDALEAIQGLDAVTATFAMGADDHHGSRAEDLVVLQVADGGWAVAGEG